LRYAELPLDFFEKNFFTDYQNKILKISVTSSDIYAKMFLIGNWKI